jgi:5-methylcytosine-specific restriction endonuclease McrA
MNPGKQQCIKCGDHFPLAREFFGHRSQTGKFRTTCGKCESARVLKYKKDKPEVDRRLVRERIERLDSWKPTTELKEALFKEQAGNCALCGQPLLTISQGQVDHLKPTIQGGSNELSNLVLAHPKCNQEKHGKSFPEYVAWRERVGLPVSTFCNQKILSAMSEP